MTNVHKSDDGWKNFQNRTNKGQYARRAKMFRLTPTGYKARTGQNPANGYGSHSGTPGGYSGR
jgi:hypothetical protein